MYYFYFSVVPYTPKKKSDALPSIDATNDIQDPLDYSFCRLNKVEGKMGHFTNNIIMELYLHEIFYMNEIYICHFTDALEEEPRSSPKKDQSNNSGKSQSRCLRLNNNSLQSIERLNEVINAKFDNPRNIAWIDLSFNELTTVDPVRNTI